MNVNEVSLQSGKQRMIFRQGGSTTPDQPLVMEATYQPGGVYPPAHIHPSQDEHFELLQGAMSVRMAGREQVYTAGQCFDVPRGTPHTMRNSGDEDAVMIWEVRPALKTRTFYETLAALEADGKTRANGQPYLLQLAVLLREYRGEFVPVVAAPLRWLVVNVLAPIGRWRGYTGRYEPRA